MYVIRVNRMITMHYGPLTISHHHHHQHLSKQHTPINKQLFTLVMLFIDEFRTFLNIHISIID